MKKPESINEATMKILFATIGIVAITTTLTNGSTFILTKTIGGILVLICLVATIFISRMSDYFQDKAICNIMQDERYIVDATYTDGPRDGKFVLLYDIETGEDYVLKGDGWFGAKLSKMSN